MSLKGRHTVELLQLRGPPEHLSDTLALVAASEFGELLVWQMAGLAELHNEEQAARSHSALLPLVTQSCCLSVTAHMLWLQFQLCSRPERRWSHVTCGPCTAGLGSCCCAAACGVGVAPL